MGVCPGDFEILHFIPSFLSCKVCASLVQVSLAIVHVADISHYLGTFRRDFTRRTFDCDSLSSAILKFLTQLSFGMLLSGASQVAQ